MNRSQTNALTFMIVILAALYARGQTPQGSDKRPAEPLMWTLPQGVMVVTSSSVAPDQAKAIGRKLGGEIQTLTVSALRVHGRAIQVNVLTAVDEAAAKALEAALGKIKSPPFYLRKGATIIEYVGKEIDAALAIKTTYELGLTSKPKAVRYRVTAELAPIDQADYMVCNPLFNQFLAAQGGGGPGAQAEAVKRIAEMSGKVRFGNTLVLSGVTGGGARLKAKFEPGATEEKAVGPTAAYRFGALPARHGVPYVKAIMDVGVDGTGLRVDAAEPAAALTAATEYWPADDARIIALARQITQGKNTHEEKAGAILQWLAPGRNIKYSGQTGSRWGTAKVLNQKFGHCWDFSDCFVTLARAAGVPARQIAGWLYGSSGHVWAEYYRPGKGWQQVDPTGGDQLPCGIYHIAYFASEDGHMPILYLSMPKIEIIETK